MPYKSVTDKQKLAWAVDSSVESHGRVAARVLSETLAPNLEEGETLPDYYFPIELVRRHLAGFRDALVEAEQRHLDQLVRANHPRRQRDEIVRRLRQKMLAIRNGFDAVYGARRAVELIGLEGRIAQDPVALLRQAQRVIDNLREDQPIEREPQIVGFAYDMQQLVAEIEDDHRALEQAFADIRAEDRETQETLRLKNVAERALDEVLVPTAQALEGWFRMADLDELANKVRPATRRSGRSRSGGGEEEQEEETAAPTGANEPEDAAGARVASEAEAGAPAPEAEAEGASS